MPKLSSRIGCNDSPFSLVNQQTESMTEKFFKESFWLLLWLWTKVARFSETKKDGDIKGHPSSYDDEYN